MNAQFWKVAEEGEMRAAIMAMDARFQDAMRRSLAWKTKPRDFLHIEASNTAHLQPPAADPSLSFDMPSWKRILYEVARKHRLSVAELIGGQRSAPIVAARHEAMYRMKTETTMSLVAISRRFGGREHTAVRHGVAKHLERMEAAAQ